MHSRRYRWRRPLGAAITLHPDEKCMSSLLVSATLQPRPRDWVISVFFMLFWNHAVTGDSIRNSLRHPLRHSSTLRGGRLGCLPRGPCRSGNLHLMHTFNLDRSPLLVRCLPRPGILPDTLRICKTRRQRERRTRSLPCSQQKPWDKLWLFSTTGPSTGQFDRPSACPTKR